MSILVNIQNEQEEKVLLAFLNSLDYRYQADVEADINHIDAAFIDQYNTEIDLANSEIDNGNFIGQEDVEHFFQQRRKVDLRFKLASPSKATTTEFPENHGVRNDNQKNSR